MSSFLCDARCFVFSFDMRFRLGTSPPRGTVVCATFPFRVGFRLLSRPRATMIPCGRGLTLVSFIFTPVFSLNSPFLVSPPRHADDMREGFDSGWSCHSAFFVSPPRHTGGTRQVLTDGLPSYSVVVSFNYFLLVFPGFIAKPFRGVGVGFQDPPLRFMV